MPVTLLLCDDHRMFREGLAMLLGEQPDWRVVGQAADGAEAIRLAGQLQPDVVIMDVAMPGVAGPEATLAIREQVPKARVVAVSMYGDAHYLRRMFNAGVSAYVLKNEAGTELVAAIEAVLRGETYVSPTPVAAGADGAAGPDLSGLTRRELTVLTGLARGRRTKQIAAELGISAKTVETYRARLMLKLGTDNLPDLVRAAIRGGLVTSD